MKKLKLFDHWGKKFNTFIVIFKHVCNVCKWWVFTIHMIYVLKLSSCTHKHSLISLVRNTCDKFYVILLVKMPVPKLYANKWEISSTTLSNCTATFTCVVKMHSHFQIVVLCLSICNQKKQQKTPQNLIITQPSLHVSYIVQYPVQVYQPYVHTWISTHGLKSVKTAQN